MTDTLPLPVAPDMLAAMEACLIAAGDMTALSRRVFDQFLAAYPDEAARFINVEAAVLRMTDETFVLLHGLASGADWAAGSAAHWVDLHRNYGAIAGARYADWTALCVAELQMASGLLWAASASGWDSAATRLNTLLLAANAGRCRFHDSGKDTMGPASLLPIDPRAVRTARGCVRHAPDTANQCASA